MSDTNELYSARWNSGLAVSGGPGINDLEAVLKLITGIPLSTVISGGLGLNEECKFTQPVFSKGTSTPGQHGFRLRDTGNTDDTLVAQVGDWLNFYYNTGSEGTPTWVLKHSINMATGAASVRAVTSGGASITNNLGTSITFTSTIHDIGDLWSAGAPTRLTVPYGGVYAVRGLAKFSANSSGDRGIFVFQNGSGQHETFNDVPALNGGTATQHIQTSFQKELAANDYLELYVIQDSGSTLTLGTCSFEATCIVPIP